MPRGVEVWPSPLLKYAPLKLPTVDLLTGTASSPSSTSSQPVADVEIIERSLQSVDDMLDRVLAYVQGVLAGDKEGDAAIGRYLMDTLGAATEDLEKGGFNSSLQVCYGERVFMNGYLNLPFRIPSRSHTSPTSSAPKLRCLPALLWPPPHEILYFYRHPMLTIENP